MKNQLTAKSDRLNLQQIILWDYTRQFFEIFGSGLTFRIQDVHWQINNAVVRTVKSTTRRKWKNVRIDFMKSSLVTSGDFLLKGNLITNGTCIKTPVKFIRRKRWV